MPLIEYQCEDCGQVTEVLVRAADEEAPACPECGGTDMRKLISSFAARVAPSKPSAACQSCSCNACPMK